MSDKPKGRRGFLKGLAVAVGGTAAALIPIEGPAKGDQEKALKGRLVHYVGPTRHCIEAILVEEQYGGQAVVQYEQRPPALGTTYFQSSLAAAKVERREGDRPQAGTWHEAATCPCGRRYSEFYYRRQRKKAEEPLLASEWRNIGYDESVAPIPILLANDEGLPAPAEAA